MTNHEPKMLWQATVESLINEKIALVCKRYADHEQDIGERICFYLYDLLAEVREK